MKQYLNLIDRVMKEGSVKNDRTGTGTKSIFGHQMRFDLSKGFPCITTKKLHLKSIIHELLWFLDGDTNTKYLNDNGFFSKPFPIFFFVKACFLKIVFFIVLQTVFFSFAQAWGP